MAIKEPNQFEKIVICFLILLAGVVIVFCSRDGINSCTEGEDTRTLTDSMRWEWVDVSDTADDTVHIDMNIYTDVYGVEWNVDTVHLRDSINNRISIFRIVWRFDGKYIKARENDKIGEKTIE